MTSDQKTNYLRIALGLAGIVVNNRTAELIWRSHEAIQEKKGNYSVSDTVDMELFIKKKYDKPKSRVKAKKTRQN